MELGDRNRPPLRRDPLARGGKVPTGDIPLSVSQEAPQTDTDQDPRYFWLQEGLLPEDPTMRALYIVTRAAKMYSHGRPYDESMTISEAAMTVQMAFHVPSLFMWADDDEDDGSGSSDATS